MNDTNVIESFADTRRISLCVSHKCWIKTIGGGLSEFQREEKRQTAFVNWQRTGYMNEWKRWLCEQWMQPDEWHIVDNKKSQKEYEIDEFFLEFFIFKMNFRW